MLSLASSPLGAQEPSSPPLPETPQTTEPSTAPLEPATEEPKPTFVFEADTFTANLTLSATVNRALLGWDDGKRRDAYLVDNAQDGSFIGAEGSIEFGEGWTVGGAVGADIILAPSDEVDQVERWGFDNRIELADLYASIGHERLGTVIVGYADSASDGIDNINLAESDTLADADVTTWNANFLIRPTGERLSEFRWGDFVDGTFAGDTRRLIGYTTPELAGFEASAAISEDYWDAALRYSGEWAEIFEVEGGVGYWQDTLSDSAEPVNDTGWGGSIAIRHVETGLNIAFNAGIVAHTDRCFERGAITGRCRGDDTFFYVKGGIIRDFVDWGATSIYAEFYQERKKLNESDAAALAAFERVAGQASELKESLATVWGAGVVQAIEDWHTELYLGYRRYHLDIDLIGAGGTVPAKRLDDFGVVMAGAKISF